MKIWYHFQYHIVRRWTENDFHSSTDGRLISFSALDLFGTPFSRLLVPQWLWRRSLPVVARRSTTRFCCLDAAQYSGTNRSKTYWPNGTKSYCGKGQALKKMFYIVS
eukprot:3098340-Rhodomonas_salina.1